MAHLTKHWHKSGTNAWTEGSSYNYDRDQLFIKAETKEEGIKFFDANGGFGKPGTHPPYFIKHEFKDGQLVSFATYCGYD